MIQKFSISVFVIALMCVTLHAEEKTKEASKTSPENKAKIKVAYDQSRKVMTIGDLEKIVDTLGEIDASALSDKDAKYIASLEGWAWNAKGKRLLDDIERLKKIENEEEAIETLALARKALDRAIEKDAKRASSYHLRGAVSAMQEDYDAAIVDFDHAIQLKPQNMKSWFSRAEVNYALGEFAAGVDDYSEVLNKTKGDVQALTGRGHCYLQLGHHGDAVADYQAVVALQKDDGDALTNLADALQATGRWEEAETSFRSSLEISTNNARTYQRVAWLYATCPDEKMLKPQIAFQAIKRAIELSGTEDEKNLEVLAAVHAANGDFDLARRTQKRAIEQADEANSSRLEKTLERFAENKPFTQSGNARR